jgi:hypothetical protein
VGGRRHISDGSASVGMLIGGSVDDLGEDGPGKVGVGGEEKDGEVGGGGGKELVLGGLVWEGG